MHYLVFYGLSSTVVLLPNKWDGHAEVQGGTRPSAGVDLAIRRLQAKEYIRCLLGVMATVSALVDEAATGASSTDQPLPAEAAVQIQDVPPEPYYWEAGGNPDLDWWAKLGHNLHFGGIRAVGAAEAIGEVVANVMGLTDSKYQYVIDALESDEYHRRREEGEEEDRRKLAAEEAERMRRQHEEVVNSQPQDTQVADEHGVELGEAKLSLPAELQKLPSDDVVGGTP